MHDRPSCRTGITSPLHRCCAAALGAAVRGRRPRAEAASQMLGMSHLVPTFRCAPAWSRGPTREARRTGGLSTTMARGCFSGCRRGCLVKCLSDRPQLVGDRCGGGHPQAWARSTIVTRERSGSPDSATVDTGSSNRGRPFESWRFFDATSRDRPADRQPGTPAGERCRNEHRRVCGRHGGGRGLCYSLIIYKLCRPSSTSASPAIGLVNEPGSTDRQQTASTSASNSG
jgi:hypothetical protein